MSSPDAGIVIRKQQMEAMKKDCGSVFMLCTAVVSVKITLSQPVACPGHKLEITAAGTPSGGSYSWTSSGARLVDSGGHPTDSGDVVHLWGFQTDPLGKIVEIPASVTVTYTHPNGTATDEKSVKIHKIDFEVTSTHVKAGSIKAHEEFADVNITNADPAVAVMRTSPEVVMKLHSSCPRETECANNHRVGWLQDVTASERVIQWRHRQVVLSYADGTPPKQMSFPVRDGLESAPFPFYDEPTQFTRGASGTPDPVDDSDWAKEGEPTTSKPQSPRDDKLRATVSFEDSPGFGGLWRDPEADEQSTDDSLESVIFQMSFTSWLVVQNKEWGRHHLEESLAYLRNFAWAINHSVSVDVSKREGSRCTPAYTTAQIFPAVDMSIGKGSKSPSFKEKVANLCQTRSSSPRAVKRPPSKKR